MPEESPYHHATTPGQDLFSPLDEELATLLAFDFGSAAKAARRTGEAEAEGRGAVLPPVTVGGSAEVGGGNVAPSGNAGVADGAGFTLTTAPSLPRDQAGLEAIATPPLAFSPPPSAPPPPSPLPPGPTPRPLTRPQPQRDYGRLPLVFEPNQGQVGDTRVRFLSRGQGYTLFLTSATEAVLTLNRPSSAPPSTSGLSRVRQDSPPSPRTRDVLRMRLVGANAAARPVGQDQLPSRSNYFIGRNANNWKTDIANYGRVTYPAVYPGVDLVYYGTSQRQLEYDLVVAPGADPGVIQLEFQGQQELRIDAQGNAIFRTAGGEVVQRAPRIYQTVGAVQQPVTGRYVMLGSGRVGFEIGAYDRTRPLTIDPVIDYSSYLGGSTGDIGYDIAVSVTGEAVITGETDSVDFPPPPGSTITDLGGTDAFVTKIDSTGSRVLYSTYFGGGSTDSGRGVAMAPSGDAYITGVTRSADLPTNLSHQPVFQPTFGGGTYDAFVTRMAPDGRMSYCSYFGGTQSLGGIGGDDYGYGIAVDIVGRAYLTGHTNSMTGFPIVGTTTYPFRGPLEGGTDAYLAQVNPEGTQLLYSTYLGGSGNDVGFGIAVGAAAPLVFLVPDDPPSPPPPPPPLVDPFPVSVWLVGQTVSTDFQGAEGLQPAGQTDAFISEFRLYGKNYSNQLISSRYLGGSAFDSAYRVALDLSGNP